MTHESAPLGRADQTAHEWLGVVARRLGTEDHAFAFRALRTWLHLVRDRLSVGSAAHFGAQLPVLIRGVYYDGWIPAEVPVRYDAARFTGAFAERANVRVADVPVIATGVTAALRELSSPGQLDHVFAMLPSSLREALAGGTPAPGSIPAQPSGQQAEQSRLDLLEDRVLALTDAVAVLVRGLESLPGDEGLGDRSARAAQEAHRIILSQAADG